MTNLPDRCDRCGAVGYDRRTLWHSCLYEMDELHLPFRKVDLGKNVGPRWFYTLYVCKGCRGEWIQAIKQWFNATPQHDNADEMPIERRVEILESELRRLFESGGVPPTTGKSE